MNITALSSFLSTTLSILWSVSFFKFLLFFNPNLSLQFYCYKATYALPFCNCSIFVFPWLLVAWNLCCLVIISFVRFRFYYPFELPEMVPWAGLSCCLSAAALYLLGRSSGRFELLFFQFHCSTVYIYVHEFRWIWFLIQRCWSS